jgi:RNA polymerase sigma factor (sigma-70 family)
VGLIGSLTLLDSSNIHLTADVDIITSVVLEGRGVMLIGKGEKMIIVLYKQTEQEIKDQIRQRVFLRQHPELVAVSLPTDLEKGFEQYVSEYRSSLVMTAQSIAGWDSAEDIVQHSLEKVYESIKLGRRSMLRNRPGPLAAENTKAKEVKVEIENPIAYLHQTVRNSAINYCLNKQSKIGRLREEEIGKFEKNPEALVIRDEEYAELHALVKALPPRYALVIELYYFQEHREQAIADKLNCPLGTVKSDKNRAIKMMREVRKGERIVKNGRVVKYQRRSTSQL